MTIYPTDFSRALIRWIPEHFLGHTGYSNGALREASIPLSSYGRLLRSLRTRSPGGSPLAPTLRRRRDEDSEMQRLQCP
jgi:hypothetical protein